MNNLEQAVGGFPTGNTIVLSTIKQTKRNEMEFNIEVVKSTVGDKIIQTVNARVLHEYLCVGKKFSDWIKDRIEMYDFKSGEDYTVVESLSTPNLGSTKSRPQVLKDYHVSLDMAKELSMVDRGEKGKIARKYFIDCEKKLAESFQVPTTFVEAMKLAYEQSVVIEQQVVKIAQDKPKVGFYDNYVERNALLTATQIGATLKIGSAQKVNGLLEPLHVYDKRVQRGRAFSSWFVDEGFGETKVNEHGASQALFTPKGLGWVAMKLSNTVN